MLVVFWIEYLKVLKGYFIRVKGQKLLKNVIRDMTFKCVIVNLK